MREVSIKVIDPKQINLFGFLPGIVIGFLLGLPAVAAGPQASKNFEIPNVHIRDGALFSDFDQWWCRGSMIPQQDPVFSRIKRGRFSINPSDDTVIIPAEWADEAKNTRLPALRAAADRRLPILFAKTAQIVGRGFKQKDYDYFFYLCPFWNGATASSRTFPLFPYLRAAVGEQQWPDWLFTDQFLFHETLHLYVIEKIDYTVGTPVLNAVYEKLMSDPDFDGKIKAYLKFPEKVPPEMEMQWRQAKLGMVSAVLVHVHVYAIMTSVYKALGQVDVLKTIRDSEMNNAAPHPAYVKAWEYIISIENSPKQMKAVLSEVR